MEHKMKLILASISVITLILLSGCSKAPAVPASSCDQVVAHAKAILGDKAPASSKMLEQCKAASDDARGCVMAADKPMKILKCEM